jgi:hypothetical protein
MDGFDVNKLFAVEGLVAVVTGGGTGLGLCIFRVVQANSRYLVRVGSKWRDRVHRRSQEGKAQGCCRIAFSTSHYRLD